MPVQSLAPQTAKAAHSPLARPSRRTGKLAQDLPGYGVVGPDSGPEADEYRSWGLRPFRFLATAHSVEQIEEGRWADVYRHVSITVWAFTEPAAKSVAARQISRICPAHTWAVLPAA